MIDVSLKPRSRTEAAYETLKRDILTGRLEPSRRLNINELAERLAISPGAVREALSRLTSDNLVEAQPQRGFIVAAISADDLRDITTVRIEIEQMCLSRAIERGGVEWETGLVAALHRLSRTERLSAERGEMTDEWAAAHSAYHEALVASCDSPWLLKIRHMLFVQAERYRRMAPRGSDYADDEHRNLVSAALARDTPRVAELIETHMTATTEALLTQLSASAEAHVPRGGRAARAA